MIHIEDLSGGKILSQKEAYSLLKDMSNHVYNDLQKAGILTAFKTRAISLEEMKGFRQLLLERAKPVELYTQETIDLCGTGGDGKNSFNISTLSSLVVAGAGIKVTKHGNYGVSSACGSSNVLKYLGHEFINSTSALNRSLEKHNICFLHAPLFHPLMKELVEVRRGLGVKTIFNVLGPLVNPARPKYKYTGAYSLGIVRLYHYLFQEDDIDYQVVYGTDGYDEISLTSNTQVFSNKGEFLYKPSVFTDLTIQQSDILGGNSIKEAAQIFVNILEGNGTRQQNAVIVANSAMAIQTVTGEDLETCMSKAEESMKSKRALNTLKSIVT